MIETLLGGVFGGALRLAPEVLKWFDRKNEREHELKMTQLEHDFAKTSAESALRQGQQNLVSKEYDVLGVALETQATMSVAGGKFISAINALVRPLVTYLFLVMYAAVKVAMYMLAVDQSGAWQQVVLNLWTQDDITILFMIISFWFVGRVYERNKH
jgi:hypothetical protein